MAIGRTFRESFAKAMRSRELDAAPEPPAADEELLEAIAVPCAERFDLVLEAFRRGIEVEAVHERCLVDRWFLRELEALANEGDGTEGLVRTYKSVDTCAAEFEAATPYYYSAHERPAADGRDLGGTPRRAPLGRHPRRRAEPDRPGDRVRLLLRARGDDRPRAGARRGDGQLQPGDGLDRLRHLRPALLRAADGRGRARGLRAGAAGGRDRPVRRPDAAEAGPRPRGGRRAAARHARSTRSTWPRTAAASAPCCATSASSTRPTGRRSRPRRRR